MKFNDRRHRQRIAPSYRSRRGEKLVEGLTKAELVRKYEAKVKFLASRLATNLPTSVEIDDLVSVGFIGLMDAADKFKENRGVKFSTYAEFRIRGAILDELRNQDWLPHCARDKAKELDQCYSKLEQEIGRRPTESEVGAKLGMDRERVQEMKGRVASLRLVRFEEQELLQQTIDHSAGNNPFNTVLRKNTAEFIHALFKILSDDEKVVLSCYYFRGLNLKEISEILGVTESRVSQIHTKAIFRLKEKLRNDKQDATESMFTFLLEAA